ncbi:MAG TPA: shikimate kinase [Clostridiales bacterium]|nr:shikimate kinase [Clostridiales bacterium]HOL91587.1 shikimate kinase [Clostridiales bacterium]HPP34731.1 shikimate kinase [Clostridiales bacterium]
MAGGRNLVLIGMPGAGKSTVGVLLAKTLKMPFTDTDILIQKQENSYLQELIEKHGIDGFIKIEENTVKSLDLRNHVIATGGSVVYSETAMAHLKAHGIIFFLNARLYQLERRLKNSRNRGIAMSSGQTLGSLYRERLTLYKKYADIEIDCSRKHIETIVSEISEKFLDLA